MSKLVVFGGSNGLGFAMYQKLYSQYSNIVIYDICKPISLFENTIYKWIDLSRDTSSYIDDVKNADTLIITSGIGVVKKFEDTSFLEIKKVLMVNEMSTFYIIKAFYDSLLSSDNKECFVMSSISGKVSSPLFATYGATKSALSSLCESLNIELEKTGSKNRITCGFATSFKGSSFNGEQTDISMLDGIANKCIEATKKHKEEVLINEELIDNIVMRYRKNKHEFGLSSYDYKIDNSRINDRKIITIGYLSGTFDLFHIGHLNLLRRAKEQCDYLIVGVHESGSWKGKETFIPFEERLEIVRACKYVDEARVSFKEDCDAWNEYHYDKLFVGSDYKGSERFARYETFFKDKGVEIIYFPYTQGTSSTVLREKLKKS